MIQILTILSLMFTLSTSAHALTQQEAAKITEFSKADAASAIVERNNSIMKLVDEVSRLELEVSIKTEEVSHDRRIRNVSIGLTALGGLAIGWMTFTKPTGVEVGNQELGRIINSVLIAAGMTVPAANAVLYQHFISIESRDLAQFKNDLAIAKKNLLANIINFN